MTKNGYVLVGGKGYLNVYRVGSVEPLLRVSVSEKRVRNFPFNFVEMLPDGKHVITEHGIWNVVTKKEACRVTQALSVTFLPSRLMVSE